MLVGGAEGTVLLLNARNSGIFSDHHVIHLLGIAEGEVSRMARRGGI
jgi:hypothetical protein